MISSIVITVRYPYFRALLAFIEDPLVPLWQGVVLSLAMFLTAMVQSMILHQYFHRMFRLGMNIRAVLTSAVFCKVCCFAVVHFELPLPRILRKKNVQCSSAN